MINSRTIFGLTLMPGTGATKDENIAVVIKE
jgi:hypothetical protein